MSTDKRRASVSFKGLFSAFTKQPTVAASPPPQQESTPVSPQQASPFSPSVATMSPQQQAPDYDNISKDEMERLQQMLGMSGPAVAMPEENSTQNRRKRAALALNDNTPLSPTSSPTLSPVVNVPAGRNSPPPLPDTSSPPTTSNMTAAQPPAKRTFQGVSNPNYRPSEKRRPSLMNTVKSIWSQLHTKTYDLNEIKQQAQTNLISAQELTDQFQKELDSGHNIDLETMMRKCVTSVEVSMAQLSKESVLYVKKPRGHFKERFAEIRHDPSAGTRLILWRSILREGKPLTKLTLTDFRWIEEDSKEVLMRDQKREKKQIKARIFSLWVGDDDKCLTFATADEEDFRDWNEILELVQMKNFAMQQWTLAPCMVEDMEQKISGEHNLLQEQSDHFAKLYGSDRLLGLLDNYTNKMEELVHTNPKAAIKI